LDKFIQIDVLNPLLLGIRDWNGEVNTLDRIQLRKLEPPKDALLLGGNTIAVL
jgi:hypothetical protein